MSCPARFITAEELQSIKLPVANFAEGYRTDEVDVFFRECVETLRNGYGLSADDVEQHPFTTTYTGGYAVNDVDLVLDRIVQTLRSRPSGSHAMPMGQPEGQYAQYAQPVPSQYPAQQQYPSVPRSLASASSQPEPRPASQPTVLGGLLSKARKSAEKFVKDNDLEGKLEAGRTKAKEVLSKAKSEADRIAAEDSLEDRINVMREQSARAWNGIQSNETVRKATARMQDAAQIIGDSIDEARSVYEERKQLRKWNAEEHTAPHDRAGIKAEDAEPTATVEIVLEEQAPTVALPTVPGGAGSEPTDVMAPIDVASAVEPDGDANLPDEADENPLERPDPTYDTLAKSDMTPALRWPSDEKQNQSGEQSSRHKNEGNATSDVFAALLKDKRGLTILIGCVAALLLLVGIAYCASQPSGDSGKNDSALTPSYSGTPDSGDKDELSAPSFTTIDTNALKGHSTKDVMEELDGENLAYNFVIDGGDGSDQTSTVKMYVRNGEEWTVTKARQSTTDGKVTLTVRKNETTSKESQQQESQQQPDSDGVITTANNPEFAALLALKDPDDSSVAVFAEKYKGRTIEFDGNIANVRPNDEHPRFLLDYTLVYGGDYNTDSVSGPNFGFEGITWSDFHDGSVGLPAFVHEGQNVHIKATVDKYNPDNGLFKLELVEMTAR